MGVAQAVVAAVLLASPRRPPRHREADEANRCENDEEEYPQAELTLWFVEPPPLFCLFLYVQRHTAEGEDEDGDAQAEPERDRIAPRRRRVVGPAHEDGAVLPMVPDSVDSGPPAAVLLPLEAAQGVKT